MQNIEINTTQNVRISYEVAHLGDRIFAFLIDAAIIGAGALITMLFSLLFFSEAQSWFFYLLTVPFFVFYTLVSEILLKGQTLGKRALRLQVVKLNGSEATSSDYFLRWLFRLLDIYLSLGMIATIFISTSKKGQRLGDVVSETSAIRVKPSIDMSFEEISTKYSKDNYEPKYPQVVKLNEKDMLLVQEVLLRYKKHTNKAHREALFELIERIKLRLNLSDSEMDEGGQKFLSTIIKDYVVLTR